METGEREENQDVMENFLEGISEMLSKMGFQNSKELLGYDLPIISSSPNSGSKKTLGVDIVAGIFISKSFNFHSKYTKKINRKKTFFKKFQ